MKYKKFAKAAASLINQDHDDLDLLAWGNEHLVNQHDMKHIWEAKLSYQTIENTWGDVDDIFHVVEWELIFPNLQKVLDHFNVELTIKEQIELAKLIKPTSHATHGYYGDSRYHDIQYIDSYDLFKFCKSLDNPV